ncbi:glycosyltransferase family 4 protein [Kordiimonas sp.]|uniref:glycosyltransferase family 4 protein n=1 Tax=Kordiimonas sp. TaxID=1970157 RepID=UPI003A910E1F
MTKSSNIDKHLLVVTHNVVGDFKGGGIEVYQERLKTMPGYNVSMLHPVTIDGKAHWRFAHHTKKVIDQPLVKDKAVSGARGSEQNYLFRELLRRFKVDLVHFQHFIETPLSLPRISRQEGIPCIFTWHDHYMICPKYTLVDHTNRYCNIFEEAKSQCDFCLQTTHKLPFGWQKKRRKSIADILPDLSAIVFNTTWSRDAMMRMYPEVPKDTSHVIEMLMPFSADEASKRLDGDPTELRVAIPGNFSTYKGAESTMYLMAGMSHLPVRFTVLGDITQPYITRLREQLNLPKTEFHGGYDPEDVFALISRHDVSLHLSIFPETYMIALSEAWAAGAVPIVSNLGAPGERVRDGENGFIVGPHSLGRVHDILMDLHQDRPKLDRMKKAALATKIVSAEEHLANLKVLYDRLIEARQ